MKAQINLVPAEEEGEGPFITIDLIHENSSELVLLRVLEQLQIKLEDIEYVDDEDRAATIYFSRFPMPDKEVK